MSLRIRFHGIKGEYYIRQRVIGINEKLKEIGILNYEFIPKTIPNDTILPEPCWRPSDPDYLKFIAAKLKENPKWTPENNFIHQEISFDLKQKFKVENKSHLICNFNNGGGCYVPVKFHNLVLPDQCLSSFGSSINLCNELKEIAGRLKLDLGVYTSDLTLLRQQRFDEFEDDPIWYEKLLILDLHNICLASIKYGLIISF
ncbi:MAG: hypothetical protein ACRC80_36675 [Waterburya sp.]